METFPLSQVGYRAKAKVIMRWINKERIPGNIRLGFQLRGKLIGIPYAQKITIAVVKRIDTRWQHGSTVPRQTRPG